MRQRYDFHSNDLFPRFFSSSPAKIEVPAQKSRKVAGQFWPDKANSIPLDFTRLQLPFVRGCSQGNIITYNTVISALEFLAAVGAGIIWDAAEDECWWR